MLVICNLTGGGGAFFREAYFAAMEEPLVWCKFDAVKQEYQFLYDYDGVQWQAIKVPLDCMHQALFVELMHRFGIKEIFVNHSLYFPRQLSDLLINSALPYSLFIHDYFYICPNARLYNEQKKCICSGSVSLEECSACCGQGSLRLISRQKSYLDLLSKAAAVIVPSEFVKAKLEKLVMKELPLVVKPHYLPWMADTIAAVPVVDKPVLTISFVGAITNLKGLALIKRVLEYVRKLNLPLRIAVVGITEEYTTAYRSSDGRFIVTGEYGQTEVAKLLQYADTALVGVLSIWEETYSYTTSEAILAGYPVMAFNIGAQAERINKYACGWTFRSEREIQSFLEYIVTMAGRKEILAKAKNTADFCNGAG